jgi:hypothetical protein
LTLDLVDLPPHCLAMKSLRSDNLNAGASKRSRKTSNSASNQVPTSGGVDLLALARHLATHGTEGTSSAIAKAAAVASNSSGHALDDFRVLATSIEVYLRLRSNDASSASDIALKLSKLTELIHMASNTLRSHSELPLTSSLSAGLAAGLGIVPCLMEPLFETSVGLASAAKDGAHSTAAARASQARKVRQSKTHNKTMRQLPTRNPNESGE